MSPTEEQKYREIVQAASLDTLWDDLALLHKKGPERFSPATMLKIHIIQSEITDRQKGVSTS